MWLYDKIKVLVVKVVVKVLVVLVYNKMNSMILFTMVSFIRPNDQNYYIKLIPYYIFLYQVFYLKEVVIDERTVKCLKKVELK